MAGRGSFIESFPLFGYDLDDYDELFAEKLELLLRAARRRARDAGRAQHRAPIDGPRRLPAAGAGPAAGVGRGRRHAGVGRPRRRRSGCRWRSRSSAARRSASRRSSSCYRDAAARGRARPATLPVGINSHGYVAETSRAGGRRVLPGLRRDDEPHRPRARLAADDARRSSTQLRAPRGALVVGSPQEVVEKILVPARAVRPRPLPRADERRHAAARARDALDRAARHRGRAARARRARAPRAPPRRETVRARTTPWVLGLNSVPGPFLGARDRASLRAHVIHVRSFSPRARRHRAGPRDRLRGTHRHGHRRRRQPRPAERGRALRPPQHGRDGRRVDPADRHRQLHDPGLRTRQRRRPRRSARCLDPEFTDVDRRFADYRGNGT